MRHIVVKNSRKKWEDKIVPSIQYIKVNLEKITCDICDGAGTRYVSAINRWVPCVTCHGIGRIPIKLDMGHRLTEIRRYGRFKGFRCNVCNKVYL